MRGHLGIAVCALIAAGCAGRVQPSNTLVSQLAREDQASRTGQEFARSDQDRVNLILNEIANDRIKTPEDKFNAALILDHSPMTFRDNKLVAKSPDNYLLGHYLARSAFESGYKDAAALVAMTYDRYLSMTTGCQKYGSNRFINQATGAEELSPVDRQTTDEERARYGIAPLATLLKQYPEQKVTCAPAK
ncbi:MAG TPA: hypothetical protein VJ840_15400 [Gemmatimonadaceae bacterium]|nr:hypothetical protein [Gemmatimonadaceae bacterium]